MGMLNSSFIDLIDKAKSWTSWRTSYLASLNSELKIEENDRKIYSDCEIDFTNTFCEYNCHRCERMLCTKCLLGFGSLETVAHAGFHFRCCKFVGRSKLKMKEIRDLVIPYIPRIHLVRSLMLHHRVLVVKSRTGTPQALSLKALSLLILVTHLLSLFVTPQAGYLASIATTMSQIILLLKPI